MLEAYDHSAFNVIYLISKTPTLKKKWWLSNVKSRFTKQMTQYSYFKMWFYSKNIYQTHVCGILNLTAISIRR